MCINSKVSRAGGFVDIGKYNRKLFFFAENIGCVPGCPSYEPLNLPLIVTSLRASWCRMYLKEEKRKKSPTNTLHSLSGRLSKSCHPPQLPPTGNVGWVSWLGQMDRSDVDEGSIPLQELEKDPHR